MPTRGGAPAPPEPAPPAIPESNDVWPASLPEPPPQEAPAGNDTLAPESGQWLGFLADLTKKQAERLKTGFARFDAASGGLLPGLVLLAGDDRDCSSTS